MPTKNSKSEWRLQAIKNYGDEAFSELKELVEPKVKFMVKDVWHKLTAINHLSDSYAFDITIAICTQAVEDGKLNKIGKFYRFKK